MAFSRRYVFSPGLLARMTVVPDLGACRGGAAAAQAVIFDNDGLLLDTESVWTRAERDLFERRGLEFTPSTSGSWSGPRPRSPAGSSSGASGEPGRAAELIEELERAGGRRARARGGGDGRRARAARRAEPSAGRRSGWSPTRRAPSSSARWRSSASTIASRSILSAHEVAAPKPAPEPYLEACRRLGVEPGHRSVALEDSPTGVAAARAAGLTVIGVPSVPGVGCPSADHAGESLSDAPVLERLGSPVMRGEG